MTMVPIFGLVFVLFIVASIIFLKFIKHIFLASLAILGLFLILTAIFTISVYNDAMQIKDDAPNKASLFILVDDDDVVLSSFVINPNETSSLKELIQPINADSNQNIELIINDSDANILEDIKSQTEIDTDLFKLVTFKMSVLENAPIETVNLKVLNISKSDIIKILKSDDVYSDLVDIALESEEIRFQIIEIAKAEVESELGTSLEELGLSDDDLMQIDIDDIPRETIIEELKTGILKEYIESPEDIKSLMFVSFLAGSMSDNMEDTAKYLFANYKNDSITIKPESISFAILKMSPKAVIDEAIKSAKASIIVEDGALSTEV